MALVKSFCIILTDKCGLHQFQDKINWGSPEEDRGSGANVLVTAYVPVDGDLEFIQVDSSPYQSKLLYDIVDKVDGHYLYELLRFPIYDPNTPYIPEIRDSNEEITTYANLIYYLGSDKFYKAIANTTNNAPDDPSGANFWESISNFTDEEVRNNDKIVVFEYHEILPCRSINCVKNAYISMGCNCVDSSKIESTFRKDALLGGIYALRDSLEYAKAEEGIRLLQQMCPTC